MKRGKQTCKILKEIRRQIADANDIEFITSECQYQGDCLGTCPKCESEVRYLEQQLELKRLAGKAITILGLSAGVIASVSLTSCGNAPNKVTNQEVVNDTVNAEVSILGEPSLPLQKDSLSKKSSKTTSQKRQIVESEPINKYPIDICVEGLTPREKKISENDTLDMVEQMPQFPGGQTKLMEFLSKSIKYPTIAQGDCGQGRIIVQFIVDKDGSILNPRVVRGVDPYLDKEALRVVRLMPKWIPGVHEGKNVRVRFTVPVMFRLQ